MIGCFPRSDVCPNGRARFWLPVAAILLACGLALPVTADTDLPGKGGRGDVAVPIDELFDQLAAAETPDQAQQVEAAIWKVWARSGSPSVDLLMSRGLDAMAEQDLDRALAYFTNVVELAPDYPEAWNKRATIFYLQNNYGRAIQDIEQTLALEPRHFGALGGLAQILMEIGDKKGALEAYRRVLAIYPLMPGAQAAADALKPDVEGRDI